MLGQAARKCRKYGNVSFHRADITNIRCRDGRFDKVVAGNVIHLLPDSGKALAELERVVKPGGGVLCRGRKDALCHSGDNKKLISKVLTCFLMTRKGEIK